MVESKKVKKSKRVKNGRKKVYRKKNRTIKNKKMIGGFKSEQDIVDELNATGQIDRWVAAGRYFGIIRPGSDKTVNYTMSDGTNVLVNEVSKKYHPDLENIAVFKQNTQPFPFGSVRHAQGRPLHRGPITITPGINSGIAKIRSDAFSKKNH